MNENKQEGLVNKEESSRRYWEGLELGNEKKAELSHDFLKTEEYKKTIFSLFLDEELTHKLIAMTKGNDFPLYSVFLAGLHIQLYKYTGKTESILGIPVYSANMRQDDIVLNKVLPYVHEVNKESNVKGLIMQMRDRILETYQHKDFNIENMLRGSGAGKSVLELAPISITLNTLHLPSFVDYICNSTTNEITVCIIKKDNKLSLDLVYNANLFKESTIEVFGSRFIKILHEIVNNVDLQIKEVEIITDGEKDQILKQFNDSAAAFPKNRTIQELFEEEVEKQPDQIAAVYKGTSLTYRELNEKANALAGLLREKGVEPDSFVGLMVERSVEMIVGMLGILKAGGAYLPIDPAYPADRIDYMLKDSKSKIVVTQRKINNHLDRDVTKIYLDDQQIYSKSRLNLEPINNGENIAYVIYTSGSTGKPKGVPIRHRSVINLSTWFGHTYKLSENKNVLQNTSISFDVSVEEIIAPLLNSGTLYITSEEEAFHREKFRGFVQKNEINIVQLVPSSLQEFILGGNKLESINVLICGGEALPQSMKREVIELGYPLYNCYGPTETTVDAIMAKCDDSEYVVIGKPIANTQVYIVNPDRQLQPVGIPGELCIGGEGVADGYLNKPDLTAEKFIDNPFNPGNRMYKTGDLAKWKEDGTIEFLGRIDHQVKIRGFRIELGEIENKLLQFKGIKQAVVLAGDHDNKEKYLCAYMMGNGKIDTMRLRSSLKKSLPHYMVPSYFIQIEEMPLMPNGKLNRKALPKPNLDQLTNGQYEAPSNEKENILAEICRKVLGIKRVGMNNDFFELGGDSIKAIRITSKLQKFGYKLEVKEVFNNGNLKTIASKITKNKTSINQDPVSGDVPLIPIQHMFFEQNLANEHHWNQAVMLFNEGGFQEEVIRKVFHEIVIHHDVLRMEYKKDNNEIKQFNRGIETADFVTLNTYDYRATDQFEDKMKEKCNEIQSSIDLENGPLVKLALFKTENGEHLLITIHHLVIDGVSWRILLEDFSEGYRQVSRGRKVEFQAKSNSFKEWAAYLQKQLETPELQEEFLYWDEIEKRNVKPLPSDYSYCEQDNKLKNSKEVTIEFNQEETEDLLKKSNRAYNTEINDLLITALGLTINEWTSEEHVIINLEGHGRGILQGDIDINRTIGWFTAQYPLSLSIKNGSIPDVLKRVKESLRRVPNKGVGYGLLKYMTPVKPWNNPEPEISFNYLGQFDESVKEGVFEISSLPTGNNMSLEGKRINEIDINGMISNQKLRFTISYNSKRYRGSTMSEFAGRYKENLLDIIDHCKNKDTVEFTPSDYTDQRLTIEELESLRGTYEINGHHKIADIYPLTPMQEGMLFHFLMDHQSSAYFDQTSYIAKGHLDVELMQNSFNALVSKYDILRTVIAYKNLDHPRQIVLKERKSDIFYRDLTHMNKDDRNAFVKEFEVEDRRNVFNLSKDLLMRISILKVSEEEYKVIWSTHHILTDGWSTWTLMRDFFEIYAKLKNNKALEPNGPKQYVHYINWLQKQNSFRAKQYWGEYLEEYESTIELPVVSKMKTNEYLPKEVQFEIDSKLTKKVDRIAKLTKTTVNTVMQVVWGILLQKYNNTNDSVFGSVVSGRNDQVDGIEEMVGLFINTIPVRIKCGENRTFEEVLRKAQKNALESNQYDYYPLADIQSFTDLKNKLITTKMAFQNYYIDEKLKNFNFLSELGYSVEHVNGFEQTNYDFNIKVVPSDEINVTFSFNGHVYDEVTVMNIKNHFIRIMEIISDNPAVTVSDIDITTDDERHQLLEEFNKTQVDYSRGKTLQELFEAQVDERPDHIAVKFRNKTLTYRELNEKSNQLARVLRQKGVNPNSIVGLMIESSLDMMIGILGILKSGGAYLPIDPTHPQDRVHYMMKDAEIQVLVTADDCAQKLSFEGTTVDISDLNNFTGDKTNVDIINQSSDLAYVIYTSGTTGQAKGVMIPHSSLINYCQAMIKKAVITSEDETALLSSHAFDLGYTTVYTALISGITLHILSEDMYRDPDQLVEYTKTCTYLKMTPSLFSIMIHSEEIQKVVETGNLRLIILGGEPVNKNDLKRFSSLNNKHTIRLINHYGPTESTIGCVAGEINLDQIDEFSNVIGKPLDNIKAYILDPHRNLTPIGVPGELYISGEGLANGYVNKPELTVEKFIENPFDPGKRMYKTGDLVKRLPDGRIEFIGRIDSQVKVRGYRIELGEIENLLLSHPEIKEAVVINRENETGEAYLAAYMAGHRAFDVAEVRSYVKDRLPHYMVPAYFMVLDTMPLTKNGKINRKELPEPDSSGMVTTDYAAPENDVQQTLVDIWSDILGVEKIGIHDNFFDLGGHSLKATVLIGKLHKYFDVEIPLSQLFEFPTIKHISTYIDDSTKSIYQTIEPCIENEYYETSSAQKRMYMVQQMEKGTLYNMPMICELEGEVDQQRIESAFQKLVIRHDSLRTYFEQIDGEIVQKIQADYSFAIEKEYRSNLVAEELLYAFIRSFQLEEAPLFRAKLAMSKEKTYLLVDMHHIISDGVSIRILIKEFMELYNGNELEPLRLQYRDFAVWQNKLLSSEEIKLQEKYWVQKFQDEVPVLNLPYDYDRPPLQSYEGDIRTFYLDGAQTESLRNIASETGSTMHMVMLTAFHILLSKYSGQEDIVIGTPIAGRAHDELQNMVGMFVNTLALRNKAEGTLSFKEFLNAIKRNSILAYENQSYQFEELIDTIQVKRNTSRHPLFDVMFSMNSGEAEEDLITKSLRLKRMNPKSNVSKFDLTLHVVENESTLLYSIEYCTKLFKEETIDRMGLHLNEILKTACEDLNILISAIDIMTKSEKARLETLNSTAREYPREKTLHQLFEEQVVKKPDQTALVMEGQSLTYKELNDKANQLARVLRQKGVQPETIVGLMTERSPEMIIGLMGILKAGGAYLPIDPAHPADRIGSVLSDAKVDLLVTYGDIPSTLPYAGHVIDLTDQSIYQEEKTNLDVEMASRQLAYVIYTSGSTGVPKGVMVEHQQVNNFIHGMINETQLGSYESILCLTTLSFDIFGLETLAPLTNGLTVIVSNEEESKEGEKLAALIEKNEVEVMQSTPTRLKMLMENERFRLAMRNLKTLFVGGEELPETLWNEVKGFDFPVFNMYGPTETTVWSTMKHMKETDSITIGKPIQNTQVYVLDRHNQLVPEGVLGELCISGDGVARGYFNREELTREKFVPNPFIPGERMYKTGDLVRWLPTGELAYAGRIDHQVKIRGFRIELGEIETQIISHPQVKEAVVAAKEDEQNQKYLCAYVVSHETLDKAGLKAYLKERLPDYMIPSYMMELDNIPLTNNGKINRTALPRPDINGLISGDYEAPQTTLQETLVTIWRDVLGVETIGIHDNFFDLGGHSLKATVVMSDIHKLLQIEVPLKEIFTSPTIFELSGYIEKSTVNVYETIELCEEQDFYETSSAQKRMYSVQQLDKGSTAYNMPGIFELEGEVDQNRIGTVFQQLVKRHETLRTSYETVDGEIVQKIWPTEEFQMISREHSATDIADIAKLFIQPFELERAPLFRVELAVISGKQYLMIDMHHIISDGVSMSLLLKEFTKLYNGESLEPLRIQYKDFAQWQNAYLRSGGLDQQAAYWKKQFQGNVPILHLPYDYERPAIQSFEGDSVHFILDEEMTEGLREVARKEGATLHMILLSAFNILLSKYSGQEDIVVGVPVAGRPHADLRNMMGMFVNTLAMRNRPKKEKTFKEFLKEVKENLLQAYDNQSYQLEEFINHLDIKRELGRNPLFDVMFDMNNIDTSTEIELEGITFKQVLSGNKISKFDLTLKAFESGGNIEMILEYSTCLFKKETIERASEDIKLLLDEILKNSNQAIKKINILNSAEREGLSKIDDEVNNLRSTAFTF